MQLHLIHPQKPKVVIGSRCTGKHELFYDTRSGEYQEALPRVEGDDLLIQSALLHSKKGIKWRKLTAAVVVGYEEVPTVRRAAWRR